MYLQVPREEVVRYVSYLSNWRCLVLYVYCARYRAFLSTAYGSPFCGSFPVLALPSTNVEVRTGTVDMLTEVFVVATNIIIFGHTS